MKLLPDGFTRGFAMTRGDDYAKRQQLLAEGWTLIERPDVGGWTMWMPWLASVGKELFAPQWVLDVRGRCWFLFGHGIEEDILRYLKGGYAEDRARALVAAADLAGEDTVAKKRACWELLDLAWPPRRGLGAGR